MSDRPKVPAAILEAVKDIEPVGEFGSKNIPRVLRKAKIDVQFITTGS
mgnify:CR=1 FL=1